MDTNDNDGLQFLRRNESKIDLYYERFDITDNKVMLRDKILRSRQTHIPNLVVHHENVDFFVTFETSRVDKCIDEKLTDSLIENMGKFRSDVINLVTNIQDLSSISKDNLCLFLFVAETLTKLVAEKVDIVEDEFSEVDIVEDEFSEYEREILKLSFLLLYDAFPNLLHFAVKWSEDSSEMKMCILVDDERVVIN